MGEFNVNKTTGDLEQTAGADNEAKANRIDIAPDFDDTVAYAKGDLCYHEGTLYEFNQAHAAGAWNSAHVDAVDIDDLIRHINDTEIIYSTTADGIKTYAEILNGLYNYITAGCELVISSTVFYFTGGRMFLSGTIDSSNQVYSRYLRVNQSASQYVVVRIKDDGTLTYSDASATVPTNGMGFIVRKMH